MTNFADPSQPLDLNQLRAAQAEAAHVTEDPDANRDTLKIGSREYPLVRELTPNDMMLLDKVEAEQSNEQYLHFVPRLVPKKFREDLFAYITADPDDESDRVSYRELVKETNRAIEVIAARP